MKVISIYLRLKSQTYQKVRLLSGLVLEAFIKAALSLPYELRIRLVGWVIVNLFSFLAGYSNKSIKNIQIAWPQISRRSARIIARKSSNNFGRTLIEIFSADEFQYRLSGNVLEGPGVQQLINDAKNDRPIILISAHFGNFDAIRSIISSRIKAVGALYRPLNDERFNKFWEKALSTISRPIFPSNRRGLADMISYLRAGNIIALLVDQRAKGGEVLSFFEKPALTTLSPAQLAKKYDASLFPVFSIRNKDGLTHSVFIFNPIQKGEPDVMMQEFNHLLQTFVSDFPDMWFWAHNRWKI